jgi:hypothetical protein
MNSVQRIINVALVLLLMVILGCQSAQKDFDKAAKANTEQAYRDFIKAHGDHPLAEEAKKRLELVVFESAIKSNDEKALENFLAEFPDGAKVTEAKQQLEQLVLESTRKAGTIEAYENFIRRFPDSQRLEEMNTELEKLVRKKAYKWIPTSYEVKTYDVISENLTIESKLDNGKHYDIVSGIEKKESKMFAIVELKELGPGFSGIGAILVNPSDSIYVDHYNPQKMFPVTLMAKNLHIKVNKELGFTAAAGLKFKQDVILNVRKDGTVEADREGVEAEGEGKKGGKFISKCKRLTIDSGEPSIQFKSLCNAGTSRISNIQYDNFGRIVAFEFDLKCTSTSEQYTGRVSNITRDANGNATAYDAVINGQSCHYPN